MRFALVFTIALLVVPVVAAFADADRAPAGALHRTLAPDPARSDGRHPPGDASRTVPRERSGPLSRARPFSSPRGSDPGVRSAAPGTSPSRQRAEPSGGPPEEPLVAPEPSLSDARATLVEGDGAIDIDVELPRVPDGRRVTLSLEADGDDLDGLEHRFEPATLEGDERASTLRLSLPIAMGPRLSEERELRVRAELDGRSSHATLVLDVEPTTAPDVYLLIGQSNMEGYSQRGSKRAGSGEPDEPHPRIRQLNVTRNSRTAFPEDADLTRPSMNVREGLEYAIAEDPLHDDRRGESTPKTGTSIGPGLSFAKEALKRTTRDIYLVPAAWGATGFCANANGELAWNATPYAAPGLGGTLLLERALLRLDKVLADTGGVLRGILWHQGGADSNDPRCAETHADNLRKMVRRLRREAREDPRGASARGPEAAIPFVVATQSKGRDERGDYSVQGEPKRIVDGVHRNVESLIPYADFVNNDDLVPPDYPCGRSSCVHFGARAMREQGHRFDAALRRILAR